MYQSKNTTKCQEVMPGIYYIINNDLNTRGLQGFQTIHFVDVKLFSNQVVKQECSKIFIFITTKNKILMNGKRHLFL